MNMVLLDILFDGDTFVTDYGVFRATGMTMVQMTARRTDIYTEWRWFVVIVADGVEIRFRPNGFYATEEMALACAAHMWKNEHSMAAGAATDFTEEAYLSRLAAARCGLM